MVREISGVRVAFVAACSILPPHFGADLILGHHAHILKGVELCCRKPTFYSVGNFAIDPPISPEHAQGKDFREIQVLSPGWVPDFESLDNVPPDSRMTMIVEAQLGSAAIEQIGFRPAFINRNAQPEPLHTPYKRFAQVLDYMRWCTAEAGLNAIYESAGDLVLVG